MNGKGDGVNVYEVFATCKLQMKRSLTQKDLNLNKSQRVHAGLSSEFTTHALVAAWRKGSGGGG